MCNDYKAGGLKIVDIPNKIALKCSWIRWLYYNSFQEVDPAIYLLENHLVLL